MCVCVYVQFIKAISCRITLRNSKFQRQMKDKIISSPMKLKVFVKIFQSAFLTEQRIFNIALLSTVISEKKKEKLQGSILLAP